MSDKRNNMLEELKELEELEIEDLREKGKNSNFSFQSLISLLVLHWHWFLISLIICLLGAVVYLRYTPPHLPVWGQNAYQG